MLLFSLSRLLGLERVPKCSSSGFGVGGRKKRGHSSAAPGRGKTCVAHQWSLQTIHRSVPKWGWFGRAMVDKVHGGVLKSSKYFGNGSEIGHIHSHSFAHVPF